MQAAEFCLITN